MGGDNAPEAIVKGTLLASERCTAELVFVGDKGKIENCLKNEGADTSKMEIVHAESAITMEDDPMCVVRSKKNSSMTQGLYLLKEGADAFVSAGNTGALHVGGSLIVRSIKGVQRAAIASIIPFERPMLLLDSGANVNVTSDYLVQWAVMGSIYMKNVFGIRSPAVGLLNNGTEEHKGTQIQIDTYKRLTESESINFVGNIEGKALPTGQCDVLVTDGFTGNITLKLIEGMSKYFFSLLKGVYTQNTMTKLSYLMTKSSLRGLKNKFDASEYGGAPLLGLQKPVIKAHGSSDAKAFANAVIQAQTFVETGIISEITKSLSDYAEK